MNTNFADDQFNIKPSRLECRILKARPIRKGGSKLILRPCQKFSANQILLDIETEREADAQIDQFDEEQIQVTQQAARQLEDDEDESERAKWKERIYTYDGYLDEWDDPYVYDGLDWVAGK